ncbi:MerR family transcriptional regulator [Clostridioides difficile]
MKIGDFSKLTKVSVRMLRYYDKKEILKPECIDSYTGHRLYSTNQVPLLQKIIMLRDLNFSIVEIKDIVDHWNQQYLLDKMSNKLNATYEYIEEEKLRANKLKEAIEHIQKNEIEKHYNISLKRIEEIPIISLRRKMNSPFEEELLWKELTQFVVQNNIAIDQTRYNNIAIYHDIEDTDDRVDIEVTFIVKKLGTSSGNICFRMLESVEVMASMMVYGPYSNLEVAYSSFVQWLIEHNEYSIGYYSRQITIVDYRHTDNPQEYLTEIQIPLFLIDSI